MSFLIKLMGVRRRNTGRRRNKKPEKDIQAINYQ